MQKCKKKIADGTYPKKKNQSSSFRSYACAIRRHQTLTIYLLNSVVHFGNLISLGPQAIRCN